MPDTTTDERVEIPTGAALAPIPDAIERVAQLLGSVRWNVVEVSRFKGERVPTFEDLGRLFAFSRDLDSRLEELTDNAKGIRDALGELDYVRLLNNVPDDDPSEDDA
jgi:hypothetical protein